MIEKMKFVSITGPKADIDRLVNTYLSKYEFHLENALTELKNIQSVGPYIEANPYKDSLNKVNEFCNLLTASTSTCSKKLPIEKALELTEELSGQYDSLNQRLNQLEKEKEELEDSLKKIEPFRSLPYSFKELSDYEYIKIRFGRIAKECYQKFTDYIYSTLDTYFYESKEDESYIWGIYFCPREQYEKIDAVYTSLHFEQILLPEKYQGSLAETYNKLDQELMGNKEKTRQLEQTMTSLFKSKEEEIWAAQKTLAGFSRNFDIRKLAACTNSQKEVFYILCGWMSEKDAKTFNEDIKDDYLIYLFIEDQTDSDLMPPTKLKNPKIFKPFEMYIRMYGLPAYNEIDPTIFVSLTYAFIFGAMFGDIGQGLVLFLGGLLLYKTKKMDLAAIISTAGVCSIFFGFMYGSIFGFELENPIWLSPKTAMTTLPFIGRLNTVFVVAIAFGMFLIIVSMILHIVNAIKAKDIEGIYFDQNALAGLVFYCALTITLFLYMSGHKTPATAILCIAFLLPLIIIFFKEPLTNLLNHKKEKIEGSAGMFLVQGVFEMFELLLSYFSNTISFIRIGAFAVSHAAMMEVVMMLAGAEAGSPNWIVVILGNIFVTCLEGLIVGIQVLRLEYYELFSRFYKGTGREFKPFIKQENDK